MKNTYLMLLLAVFSSCHLVKSDQPKLKNGAYQFLIQRADGKEIVFSVLIKDSLNKQIMFIKNADNQLFVDSLIVKEDSVFIELPFFESGFSAVIFKNGDLKGNWIKRAADKERAIPFTAHYGVAQKFEINKGLTTASISGRWDVSFNKKDEPMPAIGIFTQEGALIQGTFLTPYGDYRYLDGVVNGNEVLLSGFDGSYALYFTATIENDTTLINGKLYSGNQEVQTWTGIRNEQAELALDTNLNIIKNPELPVRFSFPDLDGKLVDFNSPRFKDKVVLIQVMGSWCPNCLDETQFLIDNYEKYSKLGVEFIGVSFERTNDYEKSKQALLPFKSKLNPPYPILIPPVAVSDPKLTEQVFPQLEKIQAYPTTIFVGKDGLVKKVYAGFDGPATGVYFEEYKRKFEQTILDLLKE